MDQMNLLKIEFSEKFKCLSFFSFFCLRLSFPLSFEGFFSKWPISKPGLRALQGSETETRKLRGGKEEKKFSLMRGFFSPGLPNI